MLYPNEIYPVQTFDAPLAYFSDKSKSSHCCQWRRQRRDVRVGVGVGVDAAVFG